MTIAGKTGEAQLKIAQLRSALGWTRAKLAHVMNASDRAIVNWE